MEIRQDTIWADDRNTSDGRYRIARNTIRGQVFWKVHDLTEQRVIATRHSLGTARAEVESLYEKES